MQQATRPIRPGQRGMTLIELMIAVVVVGILASIAYPSFMGSIRKSRRAEGISALNQLQQAQERFRANQTAYTSNLTAAPTATPPGLGLATPTPSGYYTIAIVNANNTSYEATATAVSGTSQASDGDCVKLGVRMTGATVEYANSSGGAFGAYSQSNRCWGR
jgi:type IV pilus assembly protein PilE